MKRLASVVAAVVMMTTVNLAAKEPLKLNRVGQISAQGLTMQEWIESVEGDQTLNGKRDRLNVIGIILTGYVREKNPGDPTLSAEEIEAAFACFAQYLEHDQPQVRSVIIRWLAVIPHETAIHLLGKLLQSEQTTKNVEDVLKGLGRQAKPEAIPHLKTFWGKNMTAPLRLKVLQTFVEIGGKESIQALEGFKERANGPTQQIINQAIRAIMIKEQQG